MSKKREYRFKIGEEVLFRATVAAGYDDNGNRSLERTEIVGEPLRGYIVGHRSRQLGSYEKARTGSSFYMTGEDYEPPHLAVSHTAPVWLVVKGMRNVPLDVLDQDVTRLGEEFAASSSPENVAETQE